MTLMLRWVAPVALLALLWGCGLASRQFGEDLSDAALQKGRRRFQNMDFRGAAEAYEQAVELNPRSPVAHLDLGLLYAEKLNVGVTSQAELGRNYADAIHHLEKFLLLAPTDPLVERVRSRIMDCKIQLAKTGAVTLAPEPLQREMERMRTTNTVLRERVERLERLLVEQSMVFSNRLSTLQAEASTRAATHAASARSEVDDDLTEPVTMTPLPTAAGARPSPTPTRGSSRERRAAPGPDPVTPAPAPTPIARRSVPALPSASLRSRASHGRVTEMRSHRVGRGETAASIARRYSISVALLQRANPGLNVQRLQSGDFLNIPPNG